MDIDIAFFYMEKIKNLFKSNEWHAIKEAREEIVDVIRAYLQKKFKNIMALPNR